ncbi:MAG: hypothetical protein AAGA92_08755 [Planctomycetota bacterium]
MFAEETTDRFDDDSLLDFMRKRKSASINELVEFAGVTATAVRQRLGRLMAKGLVIRETVRTGRGRPRHSYRLSAKGIRASGSNYPDLAAVLWEELRSVADPETRQGLAKRIAERLAANYGPDIDGEDVLERMRSAVELMAARKVPFEVKLPEDGEGVPSVKALACPYPDIAEHDPAVCDMEKMLLSEMVGVPLKLDECRLQGGECCNFVPVTTELNDTVPANRKDADPAQSNGATANGKVNHNGVTKAGLNGHTHT